MPQEDAEGTGVATVADRPSAKGEATTGLPEPLPEATGTVAEKPKRFPTPVTIADRPEVAHLTLTTAADALHDEEIERTRQFIRLGWLISIAAIAVVPFVPTPHYMKITMTAGMLFGIAFSYPFHRLFADPKKYTEGALFTLSVLTVINTHVAVLYFGPFTMCPVIVVVGFHFLGRTEAVRAGQRVVVIGCATYAVIVGLIMGDVIEDPGVFSTAVPLSKSTQAIGAAFVLGMYLLGWLTGRRFRAASLVAIDELARATRVASQREALMAELRADLERALRVGGPGRYSEQTVGRFKLGVVLGRGAMGEVYEAVDTETSDAAAVKLLRRELLSDATLVARFLREAKVSGTLASPHVVRVLDAAPPDASLPYLAMERLRGMTLAELLRRESKIPMSTLIEVARHAGAGIDAAAAANIVHRDLKPQNLFKTDDGVWKILDFGIATLGEEAINLTQGGVVGTPSYMAPEQAQGRRVDGRADVYSLAAVVYRCLTGRHPFTGTDTPTMLYAVVHRMPVKPSSLADVHADVDACLAVALAKSPDDRFASGAELAAALEAAVAGNLDPALRKRAAALLRRLAWELPV